MSKRVLIVDDSFTVRMNLKEELEAANLRVTSSSCLTDARRELAAEQFGLMILDVQLPDGDGMDFIKEVRSTDAFGSPAIMLLSSEADVQDRVRGVQIGADEYVGKPYDSTYVVARSRELLRRVQTDASLIGETILIIDDSQTFREQLKQVLEDAGYNVVAAEGGEEGLHLAASFRPRAVVVDGMMPDIDGPAVIRRLRMDPALRHMPCVLMTGASETNAEFIALEAGADAFLRKDQDLDILLARLGALLRNVKREDAPTFSPSLIGPKKILIVEDNETYLQSLADGLLIEGCDVILARSAEEALELLSAQSVDCILMDVILPGISGIEACRQIKITPIIQDIPVVILTVVEDRASIVGGLDNGADDYIAKSADFSILKARVLAQIRRKKFEDERRIVRDRIAKQELEAVEAHAAREVRELEAVLAERRRNEAAMHQLQMDLAHLSRWNAMGLMAATLAHEINQPLTAISNYLSAARSMVEPTDAASDNAAEMIDHAVLQSERAAAIIKNLREFIDKREASRTFEDLTNVVEEAIALGAAGASRISVDIEIKIDSQLPLVLINKVQIQQVLVNLCRNGIEAMRQSTRRILSISAAPYNADYILVEVSDTGPGISPDRKEQLFQPFSTTKAQGEGMGIGLKICQSIIEAHGGSIWAEPGKEGGASFKFRLPMIAGPPE